MRLDPKKYGLYPRTVLEQVDINTVAIVIDRKSRLVMADGRKTAHKVLKIQEIQPEVIVVLKTSAPVCHKTVKFLKKEGIRISCE